MSDRPTAAPPDRPPVVAIDGPSASGKSTTSAAVARELGALYLDSGALYRALTVVYLENLFEHEAPTVAAWHLLEAATARALGLHEAGGALVPFFDGLDAEPWLRSDAVNAAVSTVSSWPAVRDWVNARQRQAVSSAGGRLLVIDGRDIGTVVFPDAPVKVFLTATPEARARRRLLQRGEEPSELDVAHEAARLAERDRKDTERPLAPLRKAPDAVLLDTTNLDFAEQVGEIVRLVRNRLPQV